MDESHILNEARLCDKLDVDDGWAADSHSADFGEEELDEDEAAEEDDEVDEDLAEPQDEEEDDADGAAARVAHGRALEESGAAMEAPVDPEKEAKYARFREMPA